MITSPSSKIPRDPLECLFPGARCKLIRLWLEGRVASPLYLRELARQAGVSMGSVQAEVRRLHAAGLLERRADGNRTYLYPDLRHPVWAALADLVRALPQPDRLEAPPPGPGSEPGMPVHLR